MPQTAISVTFSGPLFDDPDLAERIHRRLIDLLFEYSVEKIKPRMEAASPVRTGTLRRSVVVQRTGPLSMKIGFASEAFYWSFGGRGQRYREIARSGIRDALRAAAARAVRDVLAGRA